MVLWLVGVSHSGYPRASIAERQHAKLDAPCKLQRHAANSDIHDWRAGQSVGAFPSRDRACRQGSGQMPIYRYQMHGNLGVQSDGAAPRMRRLT